MTCDSLPGGAFFQFKQSGVTVEPEEVDYRSNKPDYAHCQFVVPGHIGEKIEENYKPAEPVNFIIDGHRAHRFYAQNDMIEYRRQMDKPTRATVSLLDAQQVLQRGTIEKAWDLATFREIVEYIFENRDDPYNVLTDVKFFVSEEIQERSFGNFSIGTQDPDSFGTQIQDTFSTKPVLDFIGENVKEIEPIPESQFTEPFFDGDSPADALQTVSQAVNQWTHVDEDGVLLIGDFGGVPRRHGIDNTDGINLSRYDIVSSSNMTNAVRIIGSGAYKYLKNVSVADPESQLRPVAEASIPSVSGSAMEITSGDSKFVKKLQKISSLRSAAVRWLLGELASDSGGSLVINGLASDNKRSLAKMDVGHQLAVDPVIGQLCDDVVTTGYFVIKKLQHDLSPRRGWDMTLEVAQTANAEQIEIQTFWYDPQSEQTFDSLKSFNEYREQEILDDAPIPNLEDFI
jgi:hypothetical protein